MGSSPEFDSGAFSVLSLSVGAGFVWHLSAALLFCGLALKYSLSQEAGLFGCCCPISSRVFPPLLKMFPLGSVPVFAFGLLA